MKYFFILGREPLLSLDEIKAKFKQLKIAYKILEQEKDFLIVETGEAMDINYLMSQLAGTIKIGEIIEKTEQVDAKKLFALIPGTDKKFHLGLSTYNCQLPIRQMGLTLKSELKNRNISTRFVESRENPLSSVIVKKNKLLTSGMELVIMKSNNVFYIGKTIAVQPFEEYGEIDFGRPARDARVGMLPPKLAQIMINLSELEFNKIIYDPFCGSGTVLQQALLLGYKKVIGSDLEEYQINSSEENLQWLYEKRKINGSYEIFVADATDIAKDFADKKIDAIICEPTMGPGLRGHEDQATLEQNIRELNIIYKKFFIEAGKILKKNGVLVMIIPEFRTNKAGAKFSLDDLLGKDFSIEKSWQYARPNQFVVRNIYKITRT